MRRRCPSGFVAVIAILVAVPWLATTGPAHAATLAWGSPRAIDQAAPFADPAAGDAIACPTATDCIQVGELGSVSTTTDPGGPASGWQVHAGIDGGHELAALACPSSSECVADDTRGDIVSSTAPASATWHAVRLPHVDLSSAPIACPSVSLCVAIGPGSSSAPGDVSETSSDPTGGAAAWKRTPLGTNAQQIAFGDAQAIACPSTSLCIAVGDSGRLAYTQNPSAATPTWTVSAAFPGDPDLNAIACPTTALCLIGDQEGAVLTTSDPTGPTSGWTSQTVDTNGVEQIACAGTALCLTADNGVEVRATTNPGSSDATWTTTKLQVGAIACPSASVCLAAVPDGDPHAGADVSSGDPGDPMPTWTTSGVLGGLSALTSLSCASAQLCAAGDDGGQVLVAPDASAAWSRLSLAPLTGTDNPAFVSCPSVSRCVAAAGRDVAVSSDPQGGAAAWHVEPLKEVDDYQGTPQSLGPISCPTASFCVADRVTGVTVSTDPGSAAAWHEIDIGETDFDNVSDVSCASAKLCVTTDIQNGRIFVSTQPTSQRWKLTRLTGGNETTSVSCPALSLCVVVDQAGNVFSTTHPAGPASGWHRVALGKANSLRAVSCSTVRLCVAVAVDGHAFVSTDAGSAKPRWVRETAEVSGVSSRAQAAAGTDTPSAISCVPGSRECVVGDTSGRIVIGRG